MTPNAGLFMPHSGTEQILTINIFYLSTGTCSCNWQPGTIPTSTAGIVYVGIYIVGRYSVPGTVFYVVGRVTTATSLISYIDGGVEVTSSTYEVLVCIDPATTTTTTIGNFQLI